MGQVPAAIPPVVGFVRLVGHNLVLTAVGGISPGDLPTIRGMFKYLADTALVNAIHGLPDIAANYYPQDGSPQDGCSIPIASSDLRANGRTRCAAQDLPQ